MRLPLLLVILSASVASAQTALVAPDLVAGARFGHSVVGSFTCSGEPYDAVAIVGAPHGVPAGPSVAPGKVHAFRQTGGLWSYAATAASPNGIAGDLFGFSVDTRPCEYYGTLIGAPGAGRAYHYPGSLSGGHRRLDGDAFGAGSDFGWAVLGIGGNLFVGAPGAGTTGVVGVFPEYGTAGPPSPPDEVLTPSDTSDRRFGASLVTAWGRALLPGHLNDTRVAIGAPGDGGPGAVYVYALVGTVSSASWEEQARLPGPPGFGSALSMLHGGVLAVSSPSTGEVVAFRETAEGDWLEHHRLIAPDSLAAGRLGVTALGLAPLGAGRWRVIASTTAPSDAGPPSPPLVFIPGFDGTFDLRPLTVLGPDPSAHYGAALSVWSGNNYGVAIGDPGAGGTGAAFVADPSFLPVRTETPPTAPGVAVRVFPQPAGASATLRLSAPGVVDVTLVDLLGRTVWRTRAAGSTDVTFDTSRFPSGLYTVRIGTEGAVATTRLLIAH